MVRDYKQKVAAFLNEATESCDIEKIRSAGARTVNIDPLKSFVFQNFPKGSPIRGVLAEERSILAVPEFLAKLETWQVLLRST